MAKQRKADGGRRGQRASLSGATPNSKVLETPENPEIPSLPPAEDYLSFPQEEFDTPETTDYEWPPAVQRWWEDIWSSPMSQEFVIPADLHNLYLGCYYLAESLNPEYKPNERNAFSKSFERIQKDYGLNPSARETLKWQVAQGETAQKRTERLRADQTPAPALNEDHRQNVVDLYNRNRA